MSVRDRLIAEAARRVRDLGCSAYWALYAATGTFTGAEYEAAGAPVATGAGAIGGGGCGGGGGKRSAGLVEVLQHDTMQAQESIH